MISTTDDGTSNSTFSTTLTTHGTTDELSEVHPVTSPAAAITTESTLTSRLCGSASTSSSSVRNSKRKRSIAWNYFNKTGEKEGTCDICGEIVKTAGNTTNLMNHLKINHDTEYDALTQQITSEKANKKQKAASHQADQASQLTLKASFAKTQPYKKDSARRVAIDKALVRMITVDLQPASMVEDTGFTEFMKVVDPKYELPSRRTLMRNHIADLYESKSSSLRNELSKIKSCSITTDCWTSRATDGFITVTCHYISEDWNMMSAVLQTCQIESPHTSENLAAVLKEITDNWGITDKIQCAISDNASNIKKAIKMCKWNYLACFAHTLNLVVSSSIQKDSELSEILQKIKKIVTYFHKSVKASEKLTINQNRLNLPNHKLIQHVETRWNSVFFMLERYLEQYEAIKTTLCLLDRTDLIVPSSSNNLLKQVVDILQPFEEATREMSGESYTSSSKILPISKALQRVTFEKLGNAPAMPLLQNLISDMRTNMEDNILLAAPTLLDPRFKKVAFSQKDAADKAVRQLMPIIQSDQPSIDDSTPQVPPSSTDGDGGPSRNPLWQHFDNQVANLTQVSITNTATQTFTEMQQFLKTPVIPRTTDPLKWWKSNAHLFPALASTVQRYLSTVATSVPSERVFSKAGELISARRNRLNSEHVDMYLFLNKN